MEENKANIFDFQETVDMGSEEPVTLFPLIEQSRCKQFGMNYTLFRDCSFEWDVETNECLIGVQGELQVSIGGEVNRIGVNDVLWIPAGTRVTYTAAGDVVVIAVYGHPGE